jgi:hypothetical protein
MVEKTKYEPGTFCWVELATKDSAAAKKFYTSLFGWEVDDMPVPDGSTYSMLKKNGKQVGALYQLGPQQQGVPPHWNRSGSRGATSARSSSTSPALSAGTSSTRPIPKRPRTSTPASSGGPRTRAMWTSANTSSSRTATHSYAE